MKIIRYERAKRRSSRIFNAMKGFKVRHTHSKKCAKIAVYLVLEVIGDSMFSEYLHYQEVLKELEKL